MVDLDFVTHLTFLPVFEASSRHPKEALRPEGRTLQFQSSGTYHTYHSASTNFRGLRLTDSTVEERRRYSSYFPPIRDIADLYSGTLSGLEKDLSHFLSASEKAMKSLGLADEVTQIL
jgi:hypothetical protein